jgi:DNA-binding NarL/FixJ family response regulator
MNIRVIILDDQPIMANGLYYVLSQTHHIQVTGIYTNTSELLQNLSFINADVLIFDRQLQQGDTNGILQLLNKMAPHLQVLLFSSNCAIYHVKKMLEAGCAGYLLKDADKTTLISAIDAVFRGHRYVSSVLADALLETEHKQPKTAQKKAGLSRREQEVLELIVNEYTNPEIAAKLFLSTSTVESHRTNIQQKLGAKNTAGMVRVAFQAGLVHMTPALDTQIAGTSAQPTLWATVL